MRPGNQIIRQILIGICIVIFLPSLQGCATFSLGHWFGSGQPPELGHTGIASPGATPDVSADALAKASDVPRNETLEKALTGGLGSAALGAGWFCLPELIFPPVYAGCVATFGIAGVLAGAVIGHNAATVKDAGAAAAMLPPGSDPQKALRTEVIALVKSSTDKQVIDLGTLNVKSKSDNAAPVFAPALRQQPADVVDYQRYAAQGIDTMLETNVSKVELQAAKDGQYRLVLRCRSRLVNTRDGKEIMNKSHKYKGPAFSDTGATQGTGINIKVLNDGIDSLAQEVVNVYFPQAKQPE